MKKKQTYHLKCDKSGVMKKVEGRFSLRFEIRDLIRKMIAEKNFEPLYVVEINEEGTEKKIVEDYTAVIEKLRELQEKNFKRIEVYKYIPHIHKGIVSIDAEDKEGNTYWFYYVIDEDEIKYKLEISKKMKIIYNINRNKLFF